MLIERQGTDQEHEYLQKEEPIDECFLVELVVLQEVLGVRIESCRLAIEPTSDDLVVVDVKVVLVAFAFVEVPFEPHDLEVVAHNHGEGRADTHEKDEPTEMKVYRILESLAFHGCLVVKVMVAVINVEFTRFIFVQDDFIINTCQNETKDCEESSHIVKETPSIENVKVSPLLIDVLLRSYHVAVCHRYVRDIQKRFGTHAQIILKD